MNAQCDSPNGFDELKRRILAHPVYRWRASLVSRGGPRIRKLFLEELNAVYQDFLASASAEVIDELNQLTREEKTLVLTHHFIHLTQKGETLTAELLSAIGRNGGRAKKKRA